ncbi:hypothetical protein D6783_04600 [Candidatus Woesearchaeota archaeon]|nr:MAG: hypothetical protein D6783_04600 [Candidatus Woesearchaeota archaeon]
MHKKRAEHKKEKKEKANPLTKLFLRQAFKSLFGAGVAGTVQNIKDTVDTTLHSVEEKVRATTTIVIKTSIIFLLIFIGTLFFLVGIAQYLSTTIPALRGGLGYALVGVLLLLFGLVSNALSR